MGAEASVGIDGLFKFAVDLGEKLDNISERIKVSQVKPLHKWTWGSKTTIASGFGDYALVECNDRPAVGRVWEIKVVHLYAGGPSGGPSNAGPGLLPESVAGSYTTDWFDSVASVTVAAGAAGSLTLTGASYVENWRVDPAAAWPAGTNQATITNLDGGTQNYDLPGGATAPLVVSYGQPVPAPFGTPVISVPAIASGPAYTINATIRQLGNNVINSAVDLFYGEPPTGFGAPNQGISPSLATCFDSNLGPLPVHKEYKSRAHMVHHGDEIYAVFNAIPGSGTQCAMTVEYADWAIEDVEAMHVP